MIVEKGGILIERWFEHDLHEGACQEIDFHPSMPWIASAGWDFKLKFFDVNRRLEIYEHTFNNNVRYVQFSPDGRYLAVATISSIIIFSVNSNMPRKPIETVKEINLDGQVCWSISWASDNKYLAYGLFDGQVLVYEVGSWTLLKTIELNIKTIEHVDFINCDAFLAVTGSKDNLLIILDLRGPPDLWVIYKTISDNPFEGRKCIWSRDGRYLFLCMWGTESFIFNTETWAIELVMATEDKALGGGISNDQQVFALASESGHIIFYDKTIVEGKEKWGFMKSYEVEDSFPWDVKWSPHGQWIAANYHEGKLQLMRYSNSNALW